MNYVWAGKVTSNGENEQQVYILKPSERRKCTNYRGVSVIIGRLTRKITEQMIEYKGKTEDGEAGFTSVKSYAEN